MRSSFIVATALLLAELYAVGASAQVPEFRLIQPNATFPQEFGFVRGVRELPDGRVLVADGPGQALILVDFGDGTVYVANVDEFDLNWLERYRVAP